MNKINSKAAMDSLVQQTKGQETSPKKIES